MLGTWSKWSVGLLVCGLLASTPVQAAPASTSGLVSVSVEAPKSGVSNFLGNLWDYLFHPVNCVAQLGTDMLADGLKFVQCVLSNANPRNLVP